MKLRVITAVVGIPLLLAFVYFDFRVDTSWFSRVPLLILLVGAAAALGAVEFYRLGTHAGAQPLTVFGVIWAVLFVVAALFDVDWGTGALLASAAVLPLVWLVDLSPGHSFPELGLDADRHPLPGVDAGPLCGAKAA